MESSHNRLFVTIDLNSPVPFGAQVIRMPGRAPCEEYGETTSWIDGTLFLVGRLSDPNPVVLDQYMGVPCGPHYETWTNAKGGVITWIADAKTPANRIHGSEHLSDVVQHLNKTKKKSRLIYETFPGAHMLVAHLILDEGCL